jgi:fructokinase
MSLRIVGLGEVLWDLLPEGRQLGGAPANFAYHAGALGGEAAVVTRVGGDSLGGEILDRFRDWRFPTELVQRDATAPTSTVTVQLDAGGVPRFTIHEQVAWDRLTVTAEALAAVARADAVCFGSLAQRSETTRTSIHRLLAAAQASALKIFDVNLRQHYYSSEVIEASLEQADVLKLNDAELPVLARMFALEGPVRTQLEMLATRFRLKVVALTRGAQGSLLLDGDGSSDVPGSTVEVKDTVGAGDAFTAALVLGLLQGKPLDVINRLANEVARYVCGCAGATPPLPEEIKARFREADAAT